MVYTETKEGPALCRYCGKRILMLKKTSGRHEAVDPELVGFVRIFSANTYTYDRFVLDNGETVYGRSPKKGELITDYGHVPHKNTCDPVRRKR